MDTHFFADTKHLNINRKLGENMEENIRKTWTEGENMDTHLFAAAKQLKQWVSTVSSFPARFPGF